MRYSVLLRIIHLVHRFAFPVAAVLIVLLVSFTRLASAQATQSSISKQSAQDVANYITPNVDSNVPHNQYTFVQSIMVEIMATVVCQLDGMDPMNPGHSCLDINSQTHTIGYANSNQNKTQFGGVLGFMQNGMGSMYTAEPLSAIDYSNYVAQNFGLVKPALAANGNGFETLKPLLQIWVISRNIAYLFLVIVFILIGVMVMLRVKIDPRTVMTIQNQIPKVVIGILLITFSYAIAGLLVDAMWVITYIVVNILANVFPPSNNSLINANYATTKLFDIPVAYLNDIFHISDHYGSGLFRGTPVPGGTIGGIPIETNGGLLPLAGNIGDSFTQILGSLFASAMGMTDTHCDLGTLFNPNTDQGHFVMACIGNFLGAFISIAAKLVVLIALIVMLFRVWFMLLRAYLTILIDAATGPLWIIAGMFPGSSFGFMPWLRHITANLLVFPATIALFLAGLDLAEAFNTAQLNHQDIFTPPLIGNPDSTPLGWFIAFATILIAPEMLTIMRNAFKSQPKGYLGAAVAGGLAAGGAPGLAASNLLMNRWMRPADYYHNAGLIRRNLITHVGNKPIIGKAVKFFTGEHATADQVRAVGGHPPAGAGGGGGH